MSTLRKPTRLHTILFAGYGPGVGSRAGIKEEIVHLSLQLVTGHSQGVVESKDQWEPYCFHASRRRGLQLAKAMRKELESLGFVGPSIRLLIPGIPFGQEQDGGMHISLYNQPKQGDVDYTPPDFDKCKELIGQRYTIVLDGALKVMNGNDQNDLKVGGCYYVSLGCGSHATSIANGIKSKVGLPSDSTQEFHLSLAMIAPVWWYCHPKSVLARQATPEQKEELDRHVKIFRHGDEDSGFSGFNSDSCTGWTSHAVNKTPGFCKSVGSKESILRIDTPDMDSQLLLNEKFGAP